MTRKATWLFAAIVAAAVFAPQAVLAAAGSFTSSTTAPSVSGNNTRTVAGANPGGRFTCKSNGCRALWAESYGTNNGGYGVYASSRDPRGRGLQGFNYAKTGTAIGLGGQSDSVNGRALNGLALSSTGANYGAFLETRSGTGGAVGAYGWASNKTPTGTTYGVYGRNDGNFLNSTGVFGHAATGGNALVNGVWGHAPAANGSGLFGSGGNYGFYGAGGYAGGYGYGETFGIAGESPAIGDGTYGLMSYTDAGVGGHLMGTVGNLAGTCTVASGSNNSGSDCVFADAFPTAPIVVITATSPIGDGREYHISSTTTTGFTITRDSTSGGAVDFNWIAVGLDAGMTSLAPARTGRARAAGFAK